MLMLVDLGQEPGNDLARLGLDHGRLAEVELAAGDGSRPATASTKNDPPRWPTEPR